MLGYALLALLVFQLLELGQLDVYIVSLYTYDLTKELVLITFVKVLP
jgi:hypothetical protein